MSYRCLSALITVAMLHFPLSAVAQNTTVPDPPVRPERNPKPVKPAEQAATKTPGKKDAKSQKDDKCKRLMSERNALSVDKLRAILKKDPATTAATLPEQDLADLRRLIELDEEIMFGCRRDLKVVLGTNPSQKPELAKPVSSNPNLPPDLPVRRPGAKTAAKLSPTGGNVTAQSMPLPERRPAKK